MEYGEPDWTELLKGGGVIYITGTQEDEDETEAEEPVEMEPNLNPTEAWRSAKIANRELTIKAGTEPGTWFVGWVESWPLPNTQTITNAVYSDLADVVNYVRQYVGDYKSHPVTEIGPKLSAEVWARASKLGEVQTVRPEAVDGDWCWSKVWPNNQGGQNEIVRRSVTAGMVLGFVRSAIGAFPDEKPVTVETTTTGVGFTIHVPADVTTFEVSDPKTAERNRRKELLAEILTELLGIDTEENQQ